MSYKYDIVCISPHQDDIALSMTWLLKEIIKKNSNISLLLLSCFTRTNFAPGLDDANVDFISNYRYKEDLSYVGKLSSSNFDVRCLDLYDSPLRIEWDERNDIFDPKNYYKENNYEINKYTAQLIDSLDDKYNQDTVIFAPIGLMHKDHIITSNAITQVFKEKPLIFYEDIPYSFELSIEEIFKRVECIQQIIDKELNYYRSSDKFIVETWADLLKGYKSQFSCEEIINIGKEIVINQGEKFWMCPRGFDLLKKLKVEFNENDN